MYMDRIISNFEKNILKIDKIDSEFLKLKWIKQIIHILKMKIKTAAFVTVP